MNVRSGTRAHLRKLFISKRRELLTPSGHRAWKYEAVSIYQALMQRSSILNSACLSFHEGQLLTWQGSAWPLRSCITQTKGELRAVWIAIYQRWKHTRDKAYFKYDRSRFQAAGQRWPVAALRRHGERPTGPRSRAALGMAVSCSTPTPAWNQDISTVVSIPVNQFSVTALAAEKADAMPTAAA